MRSASVGEHVVDSELLICEGLYSEAVACAKREILEGNKDSWYNLYLARAALGRQSSAKSALMAAAQHGDPKAMWSLAWYWHDQGERERSLGWLRRFIQFGQDEERRSSALRWLRIWGAEDEERWHEYVLAYVENPLEIGIEFALEASACKRLDVALAVLRELSSANVVESHIILGNLLGECGDFQGAREAYIRGWGAGDGYSVYNLALDEFTLGNRSVALELLKKASVMGDRKAVRRLRREKRDRV